MSETCRVLYQNKVDKQCISLAFIVRVYHDARSYESHIHCMFYQCQHASRPYKITSNIIPLQASIAAFSCVDRRREGMNEELYTQLTECSFYRVPE